MNTDNYKLGMRYETFIRQSHDIKDDEKNGAFQQYMQNLIGFEKGEKAIGGFTHEKQLSDIKKYMANAIKAATTRNYTAAVKKEFNTYLERIQTAKTASELLIVCERGLDLIRNNTC